MIKVMSFIKSLCCVLTGGVMMFSALHVCAQTNTVPTPASDPVMAGNIEMISTRPSVTNLAWRQPAAVVKGGNVLLPDVKQKFFPTKAALTAVQNYSDTHSGKGLLIWYNDQLVASHFAENVSATTLFSGFSMHKSIVALTVLAAIEDGIIGGLDDPIGSYLTVLKDDPRAAITFRQLLQHTSGLAHYAYGGGDPRPAALGLSSAVNQTALTFPLTESPGTLFNYNNVNSQLAGMALEQALKRTGKTYSEYLSERLWRPLGNNEASLWIEHEGGSPRFFAGLDAGLADWLRVGVMLMDNKQQVLSQESVAALTKPSEHNASYGLSVWLGGNWQAQRRYGPTQQTTIAHAEAYLSPDVIFFDGFGGQRVYVVPSAGLVIARFGEINMSYDDSVIVNTLLRGLSQADPKSTYQNSEKEGL